MQSKPGGYLESSIQALIYWIEESHTGGESDKDELSTLHVSNLHIETLLYFGEN